MNILIKNTLQKYHQEHLLSFYDQLDEKQKKELLSEIKKIDFKLMKNLYKNSYFDEDIDINEISELKCITNLSETEKKEYKKIGEKLIRQNQYGIVILAGGNASRLGMGPKGCLEINVTQKKISLFEIFINQLKEINKKYNITLNLYIMTSATNYAEIQTFFKKKNYFDYPKYNIQFFIQEELPILDVQGNVVLKDKNQILFGPNGNGNVFKALKRSGLLKDIKTKNIKYILFTTIDNVLTKLVDLEFIGSTLFYNYKLSSKTITKENENEKDWIFCKYKNKPFMLPTRYITTNITNTKNSNGKYIYREKNIAYHLIATDLVVKFADIDLKYHRAYKKNNYIDINGQKITSQGPNTFKFEQFIFDAFYFTDDILLYRINEEEFCPIKTQEDIKKAEKAISSNNKFN